ncbi:MAG: lectin [Pseudoxanthomonas sp.]|nr:lectin [Pseudoxanthomonas sp.]
MNRLLLPLLAAFALAACAPPEPAAVDTPAPVAVEPAAPTEASPATVEAEQALARNNPAVLNFEGFGPAKFGTDEEQVRMSWGHPLTAAAPSEGSTCYFLTMDPTPEGGYGIAFMFEDGGFKRYDVDLPLHVAPGDVTVGASAADVLVKFEGRVQAMPHKYVEGGHYLVVTPEQGGDARLVFEVDPQGLVTEWRIGLLPQVLYVEGCS